MRLRAYLHYGNVFVRLTFKHVNMAQSLIKVLEENTKHEWTNDDILELSEIKGDLINGTITLVFITLNGIYKRRLLIQTLD
jgi:hypothetical protein